MSAGTIIINECWKSIDGFINYQVSNLGRVRNCNTGRILKPGWGTGGYLQVDLCRDSKKFTCRIHKLVANEFIDNPNNKKCIDHINNDRVDNKVTNLRFATYSENQRIKPNNKIHLHNILELPGINITTNGNVGSEMKMVN